MATWTQEDADTLRAAILALASGEKVQTVRYQGPPAREVTYHSVDLSAMRALLAEIIAEVAAEANGRQRIRFASHRKGFYR